MNFDQILENDHYNAVYANKTLRERLNGKFYTPPPIGDELSGILADLLDDRCEVSMIDPFCGDGRLIVALLEQAKGRLIDCSLMISLWDNDLQALQNAEQAVRQATTRLGLSASIEAVHGNTFQLAKNSVGAFDVCITNPPWEAVKPDRRELDNLSSDIRKKVINNLRSTDEYLANEYPISQPTRKFSGWGTNLARVGTELAAKLVRPNGVLGVVCPASLFGDQTSEPLRAWLFDHSRIVSVAFYPAEAKLFDKVDQSIIYFVAQVGPKTSSFKLNLYDGQGRLKECGELEIGAIRARTTLTIPFQIGLKGMEITSRFSGLPAFGDVEGHSAASLWAGREIDETNRNRFLAEDGEHAFVKGRNVGRFKIVEQPTHFIAKGGFNIPKGVAERRLVWRDVSRPNQKRRIHAVIIPPGWVAGNSLHVAYFRDGNEQRLLILLGLMNSLVFEVQMRGIATTSHASLGAIRNVRLPELAISKSTSRIAELCKLRLDGDESAEVPLEVSCAKAYGLSRDEFATTIELFPKLTTIEKETLLSPTHW
jgi:Alw26I/Eco31I/Esp3I family type II restriction m6 adenine DNA methyltransferase